MLQMNARRAMAAATAAAAAAGSPIAASSAAAPVVSRSALHTLAHCAVRRSPITAAACTPGHCATSPALAASALPVGAAHAASAAVAVSAAAARRFSTQPIHADIIYTQKIPKKVRNEEQTRKWTVSVCRCHIAA